MLCVGAVFHPQALKRGSWRATTELVIFKSSKDRKGAGGHQQILMGSLTSTQDTQAQDTQAHPNATLTYMSLDCIFRGPSHITVINSRLRDSQGERSRILKKHSIFQFKCHVIGVIERDSLATVEFAGRGQR